MNALTVYATTDTNAEEFNNSVMELITALFGWLYTATSPFFAVIGFFLVIYVLVKRTINGSMRSRR
jgi:hypothetical protein